MVLPSRSLPSIGGERYLGVNLTSLALCFHLEGAPLEWHSWPLSPTRPLTPAGWGGLASPWEKRAQAIQPLFLSSFLWYMLTWRKYVFFLTPPCEFSWAGRSSCGWGLGEACGITEPPETAQGKSNPARLAYRPLLHSPLLALSVIKEIFLFPSSWLFYFSLDI